MKRTLSLKREHLAELSYDDLSSVAAAGGLTPVVNTLPAKVCLTTVTDITQVTLDCCGTSGSCCTASASC